jgi:hypothetical protein
MVLGGNAPNYWMYETSGVLRPAVEAYLNRSPMTAAQIAAMRAYLRQWMAAPWQGPGIDLLRQAVDGLHTQADLHRWFADAFDQSIDPL